MEWMILKDLIEWKEMTRDRKPLLLYGKRLILGCYCK